MDDIAEKNEKGCRREHEQITPELQSTFRWGALAGLICSLFAFIILMVFLYKSHDPYGKGLGKRSSSDSYFNWHPFLMGVSFLLLMSPAVLTFELFPFSRHTNKNIHGFLNFIALCAAICGLALVFDAQDLQGYPNFNHLHSFAGIVTLGLFFGNTILATILYVFKQGGELRGTLKPLHKRLGLWTVMCGYATLVIGLQEYNDEVETIYSEDNTHFGYKFSHYFSIAAFLGLGGIIFNICKFIDKKDTEESSSFDYAAINDDDRHHQHQQL